MTNSVTPAMIDAAEANIREDRRTGKISKEQFQKEMLIVASARHEALADTPPQTNRTACSSVGAQLDADQSQVSPTNISKQKDVSITHTRQLREQTNVVVVQDADQTKRKAAVFNVVKGVTNQEDGLRTEARAQASPSRREIGDAADMERMPEKETPAPPQKKSVLGAIDGFKALTPSPKPLRESVIEVGAVEGPHIGDGCLTSFFEDFGSTFICQHGDIDMHNDLRDIARAQSSPSRREIDDNSEVERQSDNAIVTPLKTTLNTSSKADRTAVNDQPLSSNLTEPEGQPGASTNVPRTPQTKANGRQATNGSQPPCAIIEGVADGDDRTENDQSLRGPNAEAPPETNMDVEQRAIGAGMAMAATIVMNSWGNETYAREILGAAGLDTVDKLKASGVDQYDIDILSPVLATTEGQP